MDYRLCIVTSQVKRPMSEGFPANAEYFKLEFLDKNSVSLGQQFREILPLLWLKSGAIGKRPEVNSNDEPEMLILPQNGFAILVDETKFAEFTEKLSEEDNIQVVYFVTNSEEAFRETCQLNPITFRAVDMLPQTIKIRVS